MTINYDIAHADSLVQVCVTGNLDEADIRELWANIAEACKSYDCFDILGTSSLDQPFSMITAFTHHEIFTEVGITLNHRVAWVDLNGNSGDILKFTESVLVNRSKLNGGLFVSVDEAKKWLYEEKPAE